MTPDMDSYVMEVASEPQTPIRYSPMDEFESVSVHLFKEQKYMNESTKFLHIYRNHQVLMNFQVVGAFLTIL